MPVASEKEVVEEESVSPYHRGDQAPGFFRMRLGNYLVTVLYDGSFELNSKLIKGRSQARIHSLLSASKESTGIHTSVNAFLLDDGERIILVDAGASQAFGASAGKLVANLHMSGYKPTDVQYVFLTHMHPDHDSGLIANGKMAFPNARVYLPEAEVAYWLSSERNKDHLQGVPPSLAPYKEAGHLLTFETDRAPVPDIQLVLMAGHTPGHSGYRIRSGKESMLIWGDVVHNVATQLSDPTITVEFDMDQKKARMTRAKILKEVAGSGEWIAGSHLPFPGIGRVQILKRNSYRWLPINHAQASMGVEERLPTGEK